MHSKDQMQPTIPALGIPSSSLNEVREQFSSLIDDLRVGLDLKRNDWDNYVLPAIESLIRFCHLLPASERHHHAEIGGLTRHSLEVAIHAIRRSEAFLYGRERTPELQDRLAERWRVAIALGGLLHDIGKPVTDLTVLCEDRTLGAWSPYQMGLSEWLLQTRSPKYFIVWTSRRFGRHEIATAFMARDLISPSCVQFLCEYGSDIATTLFESLAGTNDDERFGRLIRSADQDSVSMDLRGHTFSPGPNQGRALYELILAYLKRPIQSGEWESSNAECCFFLNDGKVLIDWQRATGLIRRCANDDGINPFSYEKDELADCLLERGIAVSSESSRRSVSRYEYRKPSVSSPLTAFLVLADPTSILSDGVFPAYFHRITTDLNQPSHNQDQSESPEVVSIIPKELDLDPSLSWIKHIFEIQGNSGAFLRNGQVCIPYPASFEFVGKTPSDAIKHLKEAGVIECDPNFPQKLVRERNGHRVLVLTQGFSRMIIQAFGKPQGSVEPETAPAAAKNHTAKTQPIASASGGRFLPKRRPHQKSIPANPDVRIPRERREG